LTPAGATAIVTDSTADIPVEVARANRIAVVPAILVVDGDSYDDGQGYPREEFYRRMPSMRTSPTTASPSEQAFTAVYRDVFDRGAQEIVSLHVAARLSGIFEIAHHAAAAFGRRVHVVDSGQVSLGLGFQAMAAAARAAAGGDAEDAIASASSVRQRVQTLAMIDDLAYLRHSGRVDWLRSGLSSLLRIRTLVALTDGAVRRLAQVRTRSRAIDSLVERARAWGPLESLGVLHSAAAHEAGQLAERLSPSLAQGAALVVDVTTVIGAHVGPNCLGLVGVLAAPPTGGD
jgi:DegV family protein with EDD domain